MVEVAQKMAAGVAEDAVKTAVGTSITALDSTVTTIDPSGSGITTSMVEGSDVMSTSMPVNGTSVVAWPHTKEEFEHFMGHPDVLHFGMLIAGAFVLLATKKFPKVLTSVGALTFGAWVGLVVQDLKDHPRESHMISIDPEFWWVPLMAAVGSAGGAFFVVYKTEKIALGLLAACLVAILTLAVLRLLNINVEEDVLRKIREDPFLDFGVFIYAGLFLITGGLVFATKHAYDTVVSCVSAFLGTLLFISGCSYFLQRMVHAGNLIESWTGRRGFSLIEDLARMVAQVRSGRCDDGDRFGESDGTESASASFAAAKTDTAEKELSGESASKTEDSDSKATTKAAAGDAAATTHSAKDAAAATKAATLPPTSSQHSISDLLSKEGCDCNAACMSEIVAWFMLSFGLLYMRQYYSRLRKQKEEFRPLKEHPESLKHPGKIVGKSSRSEARFDPV